MLKLTKIQCQNPTSETIIFRQTIQYYGMKLTWMDSTECAEYSRGVFINNIAHIYVSTEAVWRARWINWKWTFSLKKCPFPIYSAGPTYCFRGHSFLCKLYSIMTWNWREWIPLSVLSTVEVFSSTILHIFTCPRKQYECVHFQFIQRALYTASVDIHFLCKIRHFMCFNVHGAAG